METQINNKNTSTETQVKPVRDMRFYFHLILGNKIPILLSLVVGFIVAYFYAYNQRDIYSSSSSMRLAKPTANVLEGKVFSDIMDELPERYITNEVEILRSFAIREKAASYLLDSFNVLKDKFQFYTVWENPETKDKPKSVNMLANSLDGIVEISQKRGLDIVLIKAESPSPLEASLIANCYAEAYADYSLKFNRAHLTKNKDFLEAQVKDKYSELLKSEEDLRTFLRAENIVEIDAQANALITKISNMESLYQEALIDYQASDNTLKEYTNEIQKYDPEAVNYIESKIADPYIDELQKEIAKLEIQRDLVISGNEAIIKDSKSLKELDLKIAELKKNLDEKVEILKRGATSNTPDERRTMLGKLLEAKVLNYQNRIKQDQLAGLLKQSQAKFDKLPEQSIEYANLERTRRANEKVYLMLLEKYQEALINEESQPNSVKIIDYGKIPKSPSKPNRPLIIMVGLLIGLTIGYGFALVRNMLDVSVKSPEELEKMGVPLIGWVPTFMRVSRNGRVSPSEQELILAYNSDSAPAESFRTLRTRLQFSKLEPERIKTILITSSIPREGKTIISANLAASFSLSNKVLLLDCDFRKPRLHNLFNMKRYPGLCDYLFGAIPLEEIMRKTKFENLTFVSCGTIPTNPAELIASKHLQNFLNSIKPKFEYIIIDSPPLATVTDAELLSSYVDGTVIVSLANKTRLDLLINTIDSLNKINDSFIGVILNNFDFQASYGSYYKYYYYYYASSDNESPKQGEKTRSQIATKNSL